MSQAPAPTDVTLPIFAAGDPFHVMVKPIGPICNLDCSYCFYLEKEAMFGGKSNFRMTEEQLDRFVRQYIESQPANIPEISFAFQGGEPTLMGVKYFRKVMELQKRYARPNIPIVNALQTNGTLLDDQWGEFLHEHQFLVGISVDGPEEQHNRYRFDKQGKGSFAEVMRGIKILQKHKVEFNTLTVVQADNAQDPAAIYDFLKSIGSTFFQFIPIVEHDQLLDAKEHQRPLLPILEANQASVAARSVSPAQWGYFLNGIFDRWIESNDVGHIFVQLFDMMLGIAVGYPPSLCVHAKTCGNAVALEHTGDLYACDHYVSPEFHLGNIADKTLGEMLESDQQKKFGNDKFDTLPKFCLDCDYLKYCHGACPKDRISLTPDGEEGLAYLCEGYMAFYKHSLPTLRKMAKCVAMGVPASEYERYGVVRNPAAPGRPTAPSGKIKRNDPCPCGSGRKYKKCCGPR